MRVTENTLRDIIRYINTLEANVNPKDSNLHASFELWKINVLDGVWINRGNENPTNFDRRLSMREAYFFLTAVQYTLEKTYQNLQKE